MLILSLGCRESRLGEVLSECVADGENEMDRRLALTGYFILFISFSFVGLLSCSFLAVKLDFFFRVYT